MTFRDSSVIIDYLDNVQRVVEFVDDQPTLFTSSIRSTGDELVVADSDFETELLEALMTVTKLNAP